MSREVFAKFNRKWKELGLHTAAFVSSNNKDTYGPWPVYNGLCTMEIDRGLPVDVQVRHILATEAIDDILIGNAYASEDELKAMSEVDMTKTNVTIGTADRICSTEEMW